MKNLLFLFLSLLFSTLIAQNDQAVLSRVSAINNGDFTFYTLDGIRVSSQTYNYDFNEKGLKKVYRKHKIRKKDAILQNDSFPFSNRNIIKKENITDSINQVNSIYFCEDRDGRIAVIQFAGFKHNPVVEAQLVKAIIANEIPKTNFQPTSPDVINFAGRNIELGGVCRWMQVNNVQCPGFGQMSWSLHPTLISAQQDINHQFAIANAKKGGKFIEQEQVTILFEGVETEATKAIYDFTGITSLLASMTGGKTLTVYYVAAQVREQFVSCVLSFWDNDERTETGLVPLLDEVMERLD